MNKSSAEELAVLLKGRIIRGYEVTGYLGNGASALVVSASKDSQTFAMKLIDRDFMGDRGADERLRWQRQKVLLGHDCPSLVKLVALDEAEELDTLCMIMEYIPHPMLDNLISEVPSDRIFPLICQIASAAKYLETRGIIHRDIKPSNIAVTRDFERAILLDLGVIRPIDRSNEEHNPTGDRFVGTKRYSPPEFIARTEEDTLEGWRAITFYQLGSVLHDMIMHRRMFAGMDRTDTELIDAIRSITLPIDASDVDSRVVRLARYALEKDWRLRLELVSWHHFLEEPQPRDISSARSRIVARMGGEERLTRERPTNVVGTARRRIEREILGYICTLIRELCLNSDCPFEKGLLVRDGCGGSSGCGPEKAAAGWPSSRARPSVIPPI